MTSKMDTPYRTEYVKTKVKNLRGALPGRAAVIILEDRARIDDADDIQTVIEHLHDDDEEVTIIEDDGTVADERGTTCNSSGQVGVGRDSEPRFVNIAPQTIIAVRATLPSAIPTKVTNDV